MDDKILNAPVRSTLVTMAAPAAFGMLMTFLFQLIDTYFVGKLGTKPLAAMSYAYPVYFFLVAFLWVPPLEFHLLSPEHWVNSKEKRQGS
ncbi:Na+-driven multidrug efflux pump [Vibrio variabilis]|uniref:Na+-driven multidrug efflux pump n=1 Tax=Vibrio variabilis TaxID=990271 RepID=A0ABQ0JCV2_9VIBR|nr:Na+-driven multidrug efflux pump [Vibrio variabilis]